jgi:hypothetical protein
VYIYWLITDKGEETMSCVFCLPNTITRVSPDILITVNAIITKIEQEAQMTPPRSLHPQPPPYSPPPRLSIGRTSSGVTEEELVQAGRRQYASDLPRQEHLPVAPPPEFFTDRDVVRMLFTEDRTGDPNNLVQEEEPPESEYRPDPQWTVSSMHQEIMEMGEGNECMEHCSLCEFETGLILHREGVDDCCLWRHNGPENDVAPEYVCTSCTYGGRHCEDCGVSERFYKACQQSRHHSLTGEWIHYSTGWSFTTVCHSEVPNEVVCPCCAVSRGILDEGEWLDNIIANEDGEDGAYWESVHDEDGTYYGEYENGDLPEDNSEKMKEVKDAVKDVGEFVFDLQDKLPEGDYLKLMDLLQKVTNVANS